LQQSILIRVDFVQQVGFNVVNLPTVFLGLIGESDLVLALSFQVVFQIFDFPLQTVHFVEQLIVEDSVVSRFLVQYFRVVPIDLDALFEFGDFASHFFEVFLNPFRRKHYSTIAKGRENSR